MCAAGSIRRCVATPLRVALPSGRMARRVAAGADHTIVSLDDGSVRVFGRGQAGQLGCGDRKDRLTPGASRCRGIGRARVPLRPPASPLLSHERPRVGTED